MKQQPDADVRVFVVWEPVLETDWTRPGDSITSLVGDARARHFWDVKRRLSGMYGGAANLPALAATESVKFRMKDVVWDAALVYPAGVKWGAKAKLLLAPVYKEADTLLSP